jgi:endonuclease YncB( thermonuclease family)
MSHSLTRGLAAGLAGLLLLSAAGCFGGSKKARRAKKSELQERLKLLETPGLVIGEFPIARGGIIDGDTVRVGGLNASLRLSGVDTEETFKSEGDRRLFEMGWEHYLKAKKGNSKKPVKAATPLGEDAKVWAEKFFEGVETVRLERDHPKEIRDRYNRYLAYVFARKDGEWRNYNVECVRAGMSPYFMKYAYSKRFHKEFDQAQAEARAAQRGIWAPGAMAYPDYEERLVWWTARAEFIQAFDQEAEGQERLIVLTHFDAMRRLEARLGEEVEILATVGEVKLGDRGPTIATLSRRMHGDIQVVFFDKDVFLSTGISSQVGEFVRVRGVVSRYTDKRSKRTHLQLVVNLPGQVRLNGFASEFVGTDPALPPLPAPGQAGTRAAEAPADEDETWEQWAPVPEEGAGAIVGDEIEDGDGA